MRARHLPIASLCAVFVWSVAPLQAQSKQAEALNAVKELLPLVCGAFPSGGSSHSLKITGDAEAKVDGLLKKLVTLGINGATEFNSEEYVGVLRSEVGGEMKSVRECNTKIYDDMKDLILKGEVRNNNINGDKNVIIDGGGNSVTIQ